LNINFDYINFFVQNLLDHFSESVILDLPEENIVLFEPSAIVKYLLKEKITNLTPKDLASINSWIEFDEFTLSKLVSKGSTCNLDSALEKIENALKANNKQLVKVYNITYYKIQLIYLLIK